MKIDQAYLGRHVRGAAKTIVGRTVNVAQALEQCGRQVMGESEVVILVSEATARSVGEPFAFQPCPELKVSGAIQALRLRH